MYLLTTQLKNKNLNNQEGKWKLTSLKQLLIL